LNKKIHHFEAVPSVFLIVLIKIVHVIRHPTKLI